MSETRRSFRLSDAHVFKALDVQCAGLQLPFPVPMNGISDRDALGRLNSVGACFLEWPLYSYSALGAEVPCSASVLGDFLRALRACRPTIIYRKGEWSQVSCNRIDPGDAIAVPPGDVLESLPRLEAELLRSNAVVPDHFRVIVMALGAPGRVLATRLLTQGFAGFILDVDNLPEIPLAPMKSAGRLPSFRKPGVARGLDHASLPGTAASLRVRWEGPFLGDFSFSLIDRELCLPLAKDDGVELTIQPDEVPFMLRDARPYSHAGFGSILARVGYPLHGPAQIHVRNHSRNQYLAPSEGHWVIIQPWDYVGIPVRWVDWIRNQVDEVWVPSSFVRNAFLGGGIPEDRVAVVPNGVDAAVYRPNASKAILRTRKHFRFLFVGGPFWRKGFDVLLAAYGSAFTAKDDVTLVIKSVPEFWSEAGSTQLAKFRSQESAPEILPIVQSLESARMAGLYAACDCLVHPYRAEGFAICVAEAMASGLPVIVTGDGGTIDYCDMRTAYVLPSVRRHLKKKELDGEPTLDYPSYADPDVDALIEWMRYVHGHRAAARGLGLAGMERVGSRLTWHHAAGRALERMTALSQAPIRRSISRAS